MKFQNFNYENEIKLISDDLTLKSQYLEEILSKLLKDTDMFYVLLLQKCNFFIF